MQSTIRAIINSGGGTLGIYGATNVLSKRMSNVIIHTTLPLFIEYRRSDMLRETTGNVVDKVKDVMTRIEQKVGFRCSFSFVSDSCNGMRVVRKRMVVEKIFRWVYGYVAHSLS